jgi:hypothetical protein
MKLTLSQAIEIKTNWDNSDIQDRVKTRQVAEAEEVIKSFTKQPQDERLRLQRKLQLHIQKVENLIKEVEFDNDWMESEKIYLIGLLNPVKSFYERYKKRVK